MLTNKICTTMTQLTGLIRKIKGSVGNFTFKQVNGITVVPEKVT